MDLDMNQFQFQKLDMHHVDKPRKWTISIGLKTEVNF